MHIIIAQQSLDWLTHIGDGGVAVAIIIMLVIVAGAWVLVTRSNNDVKKQQLALEAADRKERRETENEIQAERLRIERDESKARIEIERNRVQAEMDQADALKRLRTTLDGAEKTIGRMLELFNTMPTRADIQAAAQVMQQRADGWDAALDRVETAIADVPAAVWAFDQPSGAVFDLMVERIREMLEPGNSAHRQLMTELQALQRRHEQFNERMLTQVRELFEAVKQMQPPQADGGGEVPSSDESAQLAQEEPQK